jgi:hypothetical protein
MCPCLPPVSVVVLRFLSIDVLVFVSCVALVFENIFVQSFVIRVGACFLFFALDTG